MGGRALGLLMLGLAGCGAPAGAQPDPPSPDTGGPPLTFPTGGTTTFPLDSGFDEPQDDAPEHWLHVTHEGSWSLSGAPYTSLTGELTVTEIVDELEDTADPPDCLVAYALTGSPPDAPTGCPGCDFVFDVEFFVSDGDPGPCRLPDVPAHGEIRRMGYSSADRTVYWNYHGTGVYVPWYPGDQQGDTVVFEWAVDLGVALEEED